MSIFIFQFFTVFVTVVTLLFFVSITICIFNEAFAYRMNFNESIFIFVKWQIFALDSLQLKNCRMCLNLVGCEWSWQPMQNGVDVSSYVHQNWPLR